MNHSIATYQRVGSKRKFGVEIETSRCYNHSSLHNNTEFGSKLDCSVSGMEFDSPILYGDEGLTCIEKLLDFARKNDWRTDDDCGCHVHFDMRDESTDSLWSIAYAYANTYKMWAACVPPVRRRNTYCHQPEYTCGDVRYYKTNGERFEDFVRGNDRYDYLNTYAYRDHKTFELRLLEGILDAEDICNWLTIHLQFIDYVKNLSFDKLDNMFNGNGEHDFKALVEIINDARITDWLAKRAEEKGCRPLRSEGANSQIY